MVNSFWSLRKKLAVFSVVLLSIPFFSIRFLQQLEEVLAENLLQGLADYGRSLAFTLSQNQTDFERPLLSQKDIQAAMYVSSQELPIEIDGYDDDWLSLLGFSREFHNDETGMSMTLAEQDDHLLLRVSVVDLTPSLREVNDQHSLSDKIVVRLIAEGGQAVSMTFAPAAMGQIKPFVDKQNLDSFWVSSAQWQSHSRGFLLEAKIPNYYQWQRVGVKVVNYDPKRDSISELSSFRNQENALLWPSIKLEEQLKQLLLEQGKRVWLLDRSGHVLARAGTLNQQLKIKPVNPLIHFLFSPASGNFVDPRSRAIELSISQVEQALAGISAQTIESVGSSDTAIALAAIPVISGKVVVGAIVVEETVAAVQLIQREVMSIFINGALTIMFIVIVVLIIFASRITQRITRLSQSTQQAIDRFGRVKQVIEPEKSSDEIGELSKTFANMSIKLKDYNDYMETLAARLTHELRTPVAMVRSSIDNIAFSDDSSIQPAIINAQQGIERMSQMISRMSEAARLEHSISSVTAEPVDLVQFCGDYLGAYRSLHSDFEIGMTVLGEPRQVSASLELVAQVLDKLLANAADFAVLNTVIGVRLEYSSESVTVAVSNFGPLLPDFDSRALFSSMNSHRSTDYRRADQANMGLGLYIVKLIAEFHSGDYFARNGQNEDGVMVGIIIPFE